MQRYFLQSQANGNLAWKQFIPQDEKDEVQNQGQGQEEVEEELFE